MQGDDLEGSLGSGLRKVACRALREPGTRMGFPLQLVFDTDDLRTQALLGLFLGDRPKSKTDAHTSVFLVDDASTVGIDRDAGSAGCSS
jgi:hypothetical protein